MFSRQANNDGYNEKKERNYKLIFIKTIFQARAAVNYKSQIINSSAEYAYTLVKLILFD